MTPKEAERFLRAKGVPPLVYRWNMSKLHDANLLAQLTEKVSSPVDFVRDKQHLIVTVEEDIVTASRIVVYFMYEILLNDYTNITYVTPSKIAAYKQEHWKGGEDYKRILKSELTVIDRVMIEELNTFEASSLWEYMEARVLTMKPMFVASDLDLKDYMPHKVTSAFNSADVNLVKG